MWALPIAIRWSSLIPWLMKMLLRMSCGGSCPLGLAGSSRIAAALLLLLAPGVAAAMATAVPFLAPLSASPLVCSCSSANPSLFRVSVAVAPKAFQLSGVVLPLLSILLAPLLRRSNCCGMETAGFRDVPRKDTAAETRTRAHRSARNWISVHGAGLPRPDGVIVRFLHGAELSCSKGKGPAPLFSTGSGVMAFLRAVRRLMTIDREKSRESLIFGSDEGKWVCP